MQTPSSRSGTSTRSVIDPTYISPVGLAHGPSNAILSVGVIIAALYFGSEVFVPIALAVLLSFVLAPGVKVLQRLKLGRVPAIGVMTLLAFLMIFGLTGMMAAQFRDVLAEFPRYQATVTSKVDAFRSIVASGALKRFSETFASITHAFEQPAPRLDSAKQGPAFAEREPMPVTIRQPDPTPVETLSNVLRPLLHPLATGGIVMVFVVFILLQREDLRNRAIRLLGAGDIHRSTAALDDAARRLSGYLLWQLAINTSSGLVIGVGLWLLGVPSPALCGILFGCLRFVPYVGAPLATIVPLLLAAAVSPGWSLALWTAALFILVEIVVGQVIEPLLYGHNTGLSPVAVVVAATFWTALWGPIGLLLSTPMTVCLVVLGRHIEHLQFLELLLGDRPALTPPELFYQRMLADDPVEAADHARLALREMDLDRYDDEVILPGLLLAQADAGQGRLDRDRQARIAAATAEVIDDLSDLSQLPASGRDRMQRLVGKIAGRESPTEQEEAEKAAAERSLDPAWTASGTILCLGGRNPLDDAAAVLLARLLETHGFAPRTASFDLLMKANMEAADLSGVRLVILSCLDGSSPAYLRFAQRRLRRKLPEAVILIGAWWRSVDGENTEPDDTSGDVRVATLGEAVAFCVDRAASGDDAPPPSSGDEAAVDSTPPPAADVVRTAEAAHP